MDLGTYRKQFKKHFPELNPNRYLCQTYFVTGKVSIDVCLLDGYLHTKYGDYETEKGWSMKECILHHYGQNAVDFILSILRRRHNGKM